MGGGWAEEGVGQQLSCASAELAIVAAPAAASDADASAAAAFLLTRPSHSLQAQWNRAKVRLVYRFGVALSCLRDYRLDWFRDLWLRCPACETVSVYNDLQIVTKKDRFLY